MIKSLPFQLIKKGRVFLSPLSSKSAQVYWNTVGMLFVLLASFASPKWH